MRSLGEAPPCTQIAQITAEQAQGQLGLGVAAHRGPALEWEGGRFSLSVVLWVMSSWKCTGIDCMF